MTSEAITTAPKKPCPAGGLDKVSSNTVVNTFREIVDLTKDDDDNDDDDVDSHHNLTHGPYRPHQAYHGASPSCPMMLPQNFRPIAPKPVTALGTPIPPFKKLVTPLGTPSPTFKKQALPVGSRKRSIEHARYINQDLHEQPIKTRRLEDGQKEIAHQRSVQASLPQSRRPQSFQTTNLSTGIKRYKHYERSLQERTIRSHAAPDPFKVMAVESSRSKLYPPDNRKIGLSLGEQTQTYLQNIARLGGGPEAVRKALPFTPASEINIPPPLQTISADLFKQINPYAYYIHDVNIDNLEPNDLEPDVDASS
ncbi:hypothetical protein BJ508DRAFT_311660 [Ascobolus immersus RN42]|uniref:Uncharacterized protein n=1 Tax=Ascobolus immersus RN42 TaxID=1160509 RepID=A0A3N4HV45_ASCIM|nr:hypothetical protein BJ508DRAFT_311660 [Ascobolus immersus RN42]